MPRSARTAETLGAEREGTGVLIDNDGLILTIGYLLLEADSVLLVASDGRVLPATIVGFDHATGFGLVRAPRLVGDAAERQPGGLHPVEPGLRQALGLVDNQYYGPTLVSGIKEEPFKTQQPLRFV